MIGSKDELLTPVAAELLSQPIRRDSATAVAARSRRSARMPGAAQDAAGQSSAEIRRQTTAAGLSAMNLIQLTEPLGRCVINQL